MATDDLKTFTQATLKIIDAWIFGENPATGPEERCIRWEMSVVGEYTPDNMHSYMYSN